MMDAMLSALRAGLPELGVTIPDGADETLCKFGCELIEQNNIELIDEMSDRDNTRSFPIPSVLPCPV